MHLQGGTHKETPLPMCLVVDGAPGLLAEAGVDFGVVKGEVVQLKESELVDCKSQDPGNVNWYDGEGIVMG